MNKEKSKGTILGETIKDTCRFASLLFCALRACGVIEWAWYWLLSPIFASWALAICALAVVALVKRGERKKRKGAEYADKKLYNKN